MPFSTQLSEALQERSDAGKLRLYNYSAQEDLRDSLQILTIEELVDVIYDGLPIEARVKFAQLWKQKQGD